MWKCKDEKKEKEIDGLVCKACGCKKFVVVGDYMRICSNCTMPVKLKKKVTE